MRRELGTGLAMTLATWPTGFETRKKKRNVFLSLSLIAEQPPLRVCSEDEFDGGNPFLIRRRFLFDHLVAGARVGLTPYPPTCGCVSSRFLFVSLLTTSNP